VTKTRYSG